MDRLRVKNADVVKLRELEGQVNRADSSSKRRVMLALKNIGIPCLIGGEGIEAERLASSLVRANIAAAVYSADGDCLTHGCDLLIRDVGLDRQVVDPQTGELVKIKTYNIVRLAKVLHLMGVTFPTFVDVCIMAGCDYNSNLPNLAIGTAYPLLKEHGRIESIPSSNFSTKQLAAADDLRIAQCRRNFELLPFHQMFDMDLFARGLNLTREQLTIERAFNVYFNPNCLYESLSASSMGRYYTELSVSYSKLPQPKNYRNIVQVVSHHGEVGYDGDVELEGIVELQKDEEREHNIF
jgi:5'-3' exonuclease